MVEDKDFVKYNNYYTYLLLIFVAVMKYSRSVQISMGFTISFRKYCYFSKA